MFRSVLPRMVFIGGVCITGIVGGAVYRFLHPPDNNSDSKYQVLLSSILVGELCSISAMMGVMIQKNRATREISNGWR